MKRLMLLKLLIPCFLLLSGSGRAQTFDEWFRQKQTQERYLLEQISALRLYGGVLQQGYTLAREGLAAIGVGQEGERDLHAGFFRSLAKVAPAVTAHSKATAAAALQEYLRETEWRTLQQAQESGMLHAQELAYVQRVFQALQAEGTALLAALQEAETSGGLEMGDAARLQRGEASLRDLEELHLLARSFASEVRALAAKRGRARQEAENIRRMYHIIPETP